LPSTDVSLQIRNLPWRPNDFKQQQQQQQLPSSSHSTSNNDGGAGNA